MEADSGSAPLQAYDRVKRAARLETDSGPALRQAITNCMSAGTVWVIGVCDGFMHRFQVVGRRRFPGCGVREVLEQRQDSTVSAEGADRTGRSGKPGTCSNGR